MSRLLKLNAIIASVSIFLGLQQSIFASSKMTLTSSVISKGGTIADEQVFNSFGCSGGNISPDLKWANAPKDTKAFAVTMYDPDAPTGSGWWHWTVINIPATVTSLEKGASGKSIPQGAIEARTDFGKPGYGGPCPPEKDKPHRYYFKVFALKENLPIDAESSGALVGYYINANKIAEAQLMGKFGRKK